jgi:hypothetical protein
VTWTRFMPEEENGIRQKHSTGQTPSASPVERTRLVEEREQHTGRDRHRRGVCLHVAQLDLQSPPQDTVSDSRPARSRPGHQDRDTDGNQDDACQRKCTTKMRLAHVSPSLVGRLPCRRMAPPRIYGTIENTTRAARRQPLSCVFSGLRRDMLDDDVRRAYLHTAGRYYPDVAEHDAAGLRHL